MKKVLAMPRRGEVWLADLGLAAKIRPVLVISVDYSDADYALIAVVPHTTSPRSSTFEVKLNVTGLKPGVFNVQGLFAVPKPKLLKKIAELRPDEMAEIELAVMKWLGLASPDESV
jgi:mRNA interferase MazF